MQVSHADKNIILHCLSQSICEEYLNHTLGLTLSTSGPVKLPSSVILKKTQMENVNIIYLLKLNIKQVNSL